MHKIKPAAGQRWKGKDTDGQPALILHVGLQRVMYSVPEPLHGSCFNEYLRSKGSFFVDNEPFQHQTGAYFDFQRYEYLDECTSALVARAQGWEQYCINGEWLEIDSQDNGYCYLLLRKRIKSKCPHCGEELS